MADFPYPNAVEIATGKTIDLSQRLVQYVLHTEIPEAPIFETSPGSKEYFIVDRIAGDGAGSSEANAIAFLQWEYETAYSWHNWHVGSNNVLYRLKLDPDKSLLDEKSVCGCGSGAYESEDAANTVAYYGVFKLPSNVIPTIEKDFIFAKFSQRYIKINYVPEKGKICVEPEVVCLVD